MSSFRSPRILNIATILLLLLTNFAVTTTALPSNLPYPAQSSPLDTLNSRENTIAAVQARGDDDDTTTTPNENLPDVNPATHGIPGVQSYTGASSNATPPQPAPRDQTKNPSPPSKRDGIPGRRGQRGRRAATAEQPMMGSGGDDDDADGTLADEEKQTRKGRRNCIQPTMGPDGEWDYTVAGGSIAC